MHEEDESQKHKNYGISLLRMLMCFEVVLHHFWIGAFPQVLRPFKVLENAAVPVFVFIAFFFCEKIVLEANSNSLKKRFVRLFVPQVGWAFIYWILFVIAEVIFPELKDEWGLVRVSDLFWQIFTGNSPVVNVSMWFQFDLIVITFIFVLIFRFCKTSINGKLMLIILFFISFVFQYSDLNLLLFGSLRYELSNPLGRLFEMIPYAVIGLFCANYKIFERLKFKRAFFIIFFSFVSIFSFIYNIVAPIDGFGYSNNTFLIIAFCLTGIAYLLPLDKLPPNILTIINCITKYTLGIYCMHRLVGLGIKFGMIKLGIEFSSFILSIVTYIICFLVSFVISKIPIRVIRMLVE